MSDDKQIWDVAFKLRQEIINASSIKLPEHLKVDDIFKGDVSSFRFSSELFQLPHRRSR